MPRLPIDKAVIGRTAGRNLGRLIRLVWRTSRITIEPASFPAEVVAGPPVIFAMWHGQFMLVPVVKPASYLVRIMVARHGDAEIFAETLKGFNAELIRGAGAGDRRRDRGGAHALREAIRSLDDGVTVAMTADIPPGPARVAGAGIVTLARLSRRPIVPIAVATSRYRSFDTWSRLTINLPFSRLGVAFGEPIHVAADVDAAGAEQARLLVQERLNRATARAYELAGADPSRATPTSQAANQPPTKPGWRLQTYRGLMRIATPAAPLVLSERGKRGKEDPKRSGERMGRPGATRAPGLLVWVHAASIGETNAVLPVIAEMSQRRPELNFLLTTGTVTSAELAARRLGPRTVHQYVPIDTPAFVARFFDHWRPDLGVFTESEIWPNLILEASDRRIPLVLVNGRMSDRSYRRWRRNKSMSRPLFNRFALVLATTAALVRQYTELGVRTARSVGNLKIDAPPPPVDAAALAALESAVQGRPRIVAASTHDGEDEMVAAAHVAMRASLPSLITIIAPRHPERGAAIATALTAAGLSVRRRSAGELPDATTEIYIADTIGELGTFYTLSPVAFIGGSLIEHGGQNPIEAIRHGAAVITGPSWLNFADAYRPLIKSGGAVEIRDAAHLASAAVRLLTDTAERDRANASAQAVVASLSGALEATVTALIDLLPPTEGLRRGS